MNRSQVRHKVMSQQIPGHVAPEITIRLDYRTSIIEVMDKLVVSNVNPKVIGITGADCHAEKITRAKILSSPRADHFKALPVMQEADKIELIGRPIRRAGVIGNFDIKILLVKAAKQGEAVALSRLVGVADEVIP